MLLSSAVVLVLGDDKILGGALSHEVRVRHSPAQLAAQVLGALQCWRFDRQGRALSRKPVFKQHGFSAHLCLESS